MQPGSPGAPPEPLEAPVSPDQGALEAFDEAAGLPAPAAAAAAAATAPEADEPQPAEAEGEQEEDIVRTMSRQLSRLSIPDSATASATAAAGGSAPGSADSAGAALAGLEELPSPEQPSPPARPNFQPTCEPSPELFERVAVGGAAAAAAPTSPPEGFYPRSKSVSPVQRKIREMEVGGGCWGPALVLSLPDSAQPDGA